jgi:hypothetical protein
MSVVLCLLECSVSSLANSLCHTHDFEVRRLVLAACRHSLEKSTSLVVGSEEGAGLRGVGAKLRGVRAGLRGVVAAAAAATDGVDAGYGSQASYQRGLQQVSRNGRVVVLIIAKRCRRRGSALIIQTIVASLLAYAPNV